MSKLFKKSLSIYLLFILGGLIISLLAIFDSLCQKKSGQDIPTNEKQIILKPFQIIRYMYSAAAPASILVDGNTSIGYHPGYSSKHYYPVKIVIDLLGRYHVSAFKMFDIGGGAEVEIRSGMDLFSMKKNSTITLDGSGIRSILIDAEVNFIELEIKTVQGKGPSEIYVYGSPVSIPSVPALRLPEKKTFENMVGFNANSYIPADLFWKGTTIRQYEYLVKPFPAIGELRLNPSLQGGTFYDIEYKVRKDSGFIISPCTFHLPEKIYKPSYDAAGHPWNPSYRPILYGADPALPGSYKIMAELAYQFAARYGRTPVPFSKITINTKPDENGYNINEKKTALDLLQYMEFGNEQDRWWADTNEALLPFQMAAQNSALYDGHEGKVSDIAGMKRADPTMKVVMPALASINIDYVKLMYYWSKRYRVDGKFPADVINFHYYTNTTGDQYTGNSKAICPEKDNIKDRIIQFTDFVLRYIPNAEIWWSEFGFDTNMNSNFGAENNGIRPNIPEFDTWRLQCAWLLRTYFEGMSTGRISKFISYEMMNEHNSPEFPNDTTWQVKYTNQFASSGLTLGEWANYSAISTAPIDVAKASGIFTFTVNCPAGILRFKTGDKFQAEKKGKKGNQAVIVKGIVQSYSGNKIVAKITEHEGTGIVKDWDIHTPFAKKNSWFGMNNAIAVLSGCKFEADSSNINFRIHKWSDGKHKDVFLVWSPTQNNVKLPNSLIRIGHGNCTYRDLESKTGEEVKVKVTNGTITTTVTEMPKIFYSIY